MDEITQNLKAEELFNSHMSLAPCTVHKLFPYVKGILKKYNLEREDLDQYSYEALWLAATQFDETKGNRTFKNYAIKRIRWSILTRLNKDCKIMSFAHSGVDPNDVKYVSLDKIASLDGDGCTFHDLIPNNNIAIFDSAHSKMTSNRLIEPLSDKHKRIVLLKAQGYNCKEIGEMLGVTRENIRQIIKRVGKNSQKLRNKLVEVR